MSQNYKLSLKRLINLAFGIAILDGGVVIAMQIFDFLLNYFFLRMPEISAEAQSVNSNILLIAMLSLLNLSAIIYRLIHLAHGSRISPPLCYHNALQRLPAMVLMCLLIGLTLVSVIVQVFKLVAASSPESLIGYLGILSILAFALIPYGILASIFLVAQTKNPIQAIKSTYYFVRYHGNFRLLASLSLMYMLPVLFSSIALNPILAPYFKLFSSVWILFCHITTIALFLDTVNRDHLSQNATENGKTSKNKVVII